MKFKRRIIAILLIFALALSSNIITTPKTSSAMIVEMYDYVTVVRVVDGDTFIADFEGKSNVRVRLIGIDTPESVHPDSSRNTKWGKKISKYTKKKLTGKKIKLTYDKEIYDKYNRVLAYAYLDGKMYNKTLLNKGYAKAVYYSPNGKYRKTFEKCQKKAKKKHKGFWKKGEYKKAFPNG